MLISIEPGSILLSYTVFNMLNGLFSNLNTQQLLNSHYYISQLVRAVWLVNFAAVFHFTAR